MNSSLIVLLDLAMPDIDGIETARQMHALNPSVPLILFTLLDPQGLFRKAPPGRQASCGLFPSRKVGS
jgi:CheY-like chemotaxis protein